MPGWGFRPESGQSAAGANTIAARAKGFQPYYAFDGGGGMASKRNVIATNKGWVRREYVGTRKKEEIIKTKLNSSLIYTVNHIYDHLTNGCELVCSLNETVKLMEFINKIKNKS